jgi:hypothetical protein
MALATLASLRGASEISSGRAEGGPFARRRGPVRVSVDHNSSESLRGGLITVLGGRHEFTGRTFIANFSNHLDDSEI